MKHRFLEDAATIMYGLFWINIMFALATITIVAWSWLLGYLEFLVK